MPVSSSTEVPDAKCCCKHCQGIVAHDIILRYNNMQRDRFASPRIRRSLRRVESGQTNVSVLYTSVVDHQLLRVRRRSACRTTPDEVGEYMSYCRPVVMIIHTYIYIYSLTFPCLRRSRKPVLTVKCLATRFRTRRRRVQNIPPSPNPHPATTFSRFLSIDLHPKTFSPGI